MNVIRRIGRTALVLLLGLLLLPLAPAHAAEGDGWSVEPSGPDGPGQRPHFSYSLEPGQVIRDTVSVSNLTTEDITFAIYPKDAYNTPRDASFALLADEEDSVDVGSWISFVDEATSIEYTVPARTRVDIPFELNVPQNAQPGDHAGGIIAANVEPVDALETEGLNVNVRQRVAARVYVRVDGPLNPALQVSRIDTSVSMPIIPWVTGRGDSTISYEVTNTGNLRLNPVADVKVTGLFGRTVRSFASRELPELLPGASITIDQAWSGLPPMEPLTVKVAVSSTDGMVDQARSKGFFVWSWAAIALTLVALAGIGYRIYTRRRARRRPAAHAGPAHERRCRTDGGSSSGQEATQGASEREDDLDVHDDDAPSLPEPDRDAEGERDPEPVSSSRLGAEIRIEHRPEPAARDGGS